MAIYRLNVTYPDGHGEDIDDTFETFEQAQKFAENLLNQIEHTERYKAKGKKKATYMILEDDGRSKVVFDSRKDK